MKERNTVVDITGRTKLFAIIGDPVRQVKTPEVINALLRERGFDGVMVAIHVAPDALSAVLHGMKHMQNLGGLIITVPHKTQAIALCDDVTTRAQLVGAVNCIRREPSGALTGTIFDGTGFIEGLRGHGIEPRGMATFIVGAGGAANAIAFALAEVGVLRISIVNRTAKKADDLAARLRARYPALQIDTQMAVPTGHDLVINTTSLGLSPGDPLPIDPALLEPSQIIAEIIMQPELTPLLVAAGVRGCRVHPGRPMLDAQIDLMAAYFGIP